MSLSAVTRGQLSTANSPTPRSAIALSSPSKKIDQFDTAHIGASPYGHPTILSAKELANFYVRNVTAADAKYKGKVVILNGAVSSVGTTSQGDPYIAFFTKNQFPVICTFLGRNPVKSDHIRAGQSIRVEGFCEGLYQPYPMLRNLSAIGVDDAVVAGK